MGDDLSNTFGFELLNKLYDTQVTKKEDILVLFVHWYFIKNGFRCIGLGDSKTRESGEKGSELLPEGWNQQPNYTLRYVFKEKLYILLGTKSDSDFLFNLLRVEGNEASSIQFLVETTVNSLHGSLDILMPTYQTALNTIENDLLAPIYRNRSENSTQTSQQSTNEERRDVEFPFGRNRVPWIPSSAPSWEPDGSLRNIGARDLDPLGEGNGGGMLYDPLRIPPRRPSGGLGVPGRLPPGAVPPGARFDPFGPPDILRPRLPPRGPDSDHLPPPGYDDMFM